MHRKNILIIAALSDMAHNGFISTNPSEDLSCFLIELKFTMPIKGRAKVSRVVSDCDEFFSGSSGWEQLYKTCGLLYAPSARTPALRLPRGGARSTTFLLAFSASFSDLCRIAQCCPKGSFSTGPPVPDSASRRASASKKLESDSAYRKSSFRCRRRGPH